LLKRTGGRKSGYWEVFDVNIQIISKLKPSHPSATHCSRV
jgi:hypothetical protein